MIHGVVNNFFPKILGQGALNFIIGPKRYYETRQTGVKIVIESELLVLAVSNMA